MFVASKCILCNPPNYNFVILLTKAFVWTVLSKKAFSTALQLYSHNLISNLKFKEDINKEVVVAFVVCERCYLVARNKLKRVGG